MGRQAAQPSPAQPPVHQTSPPRAVRLALTCPRRSPAGVADGARQRWPTGGGGAPVTAAARWVEQIHWCLCMEREPQQNPAPHQPPGYPSLNACVVSPAQALGWIVRFSIVRAPSSVEMASFNALYLHTAHRSTEATIAVVPAPDLGRTVELESVVRRRGNGLAERSPSGRGAEGRGAEWDSGAKGRCGCLTVGRGRDRGGDGCVGVWRLCRQRRV